MSFAPLPREQRLIELIKQITAENLIGDDCAVLPGGCLVSSDMLVEGKHFILSQTGFENLGWKSMAVNLSDIAAMGGRPEYALVNIALPEKVSEDDFRRLYASLNDCARKYGTRVVGGDLTGGDLLVVSITVLGVAEASALRRSAARPGDIVVVTGDFGASFLGLLIMQQGLEAEAGATELVLRHCRPEPRLVEAGLLLAHSTAEPAACMDSSDGLADALLQLAGASRVALQIEADRIPLSKQTKGFCSRLKIDWLEAALYGGEDYELVACLRKSDWPGLEATGLFKAIGVAVDGLGVTVEAPGRQPFVLEQRKTFQHWTGA